MLLITSTNNVEVHTMAEDERKCILDVKDVPEAHVVCQLCRNIESQPVSTVAHTNLLAIIETLIGSEFKPDEVSNVCKSCDGKLKEFFDYRELVRRNLTSLAEECTKVKEEDDEEQETFEGLAADEDDVPLSTLKRNPRKVRKIIRKKRSVQESDTENEGNLEEDDRKIREFFDLSCRQCDDIFETFGRWKTHMKNEHQMFRPYIECCKIQLHARSNLLTHRTLHVNPDVFKCKFCSRQCKSDHRLKEHLLSRHNQGEKRFKCDVCAKLFPALTSLKKHQYVHLSDDERKQLKARNTCHLCGLGFLTSSILTYHIRQRHEGKYACVCDICAKSFKTKQNFLAHYQNHHIAVGASKQQCTVCSQWLSDTGSLRRHVKNMHQNKGPHFCGICGKQTPTQNALKAHLSYVHNDERKYACTICDKAFKRPIGLKEHMTIHIGGALYSCSFCTKTFNSSANLYSHRKKMHQEEYEATRKKKEVSQ